MYSTQQKIIVEDIRDDLVFLKDGGAAAVLVTSAVNFGLLFETEQMAIIDAYAQMLNSLSFPIQIVIRSKRLDITSYLQTIDEAMRKQANPLLTELTISYRKFVEGLIKENDVLDKQFYVCLNVSSLELGLVSKQILQRSRKAQAMLSTRRDHILRQLGRIGLKGRQLTTAQLVELFYDIYNPDNRYFSGDKNSAVTEAAPAPQKAPLPPKTEPAPLKRIVPTPAPPPPAAPRAAMPQVNSPRPIPNQYQLNMPRPLVNRPLTAPPPLAAPTVTTPVAKSPSGPFIVEELNDDLGP